MHWPIRSSADAHHLFCGWDTVSTVRALPEAPTTTSSLEVYACFEAMIPV